MHVVVNAVKRFLSEMSAFVTIRNVLPRGQVGNRSQPFSPRMILRWTERSLHAVPIRAVGKDSPCLGVSNSERGYHVFSDVGTKLEFVSFNEAVHVRVATDIFSRIGLTRCLSDPYIPSAGCGDLIS